MSARRAFAGVDVGGTKIRAGLVDGEGRILWRQTVDTPVRRDPETVADLVVELLDRGMADLGLPPDGLAAVGVGVTGPVDRERGVALLSPNFGWREVPFARLVRDRLPGAPHVCLDNDVYMVAYGEWQYGAGRGSDHLAVVTVGTGVGMALILDGRPYHGGRGAAGEIGHTVVEPGGPPCGCGNRGCLEQLASGTALAREAARLGISGPDGSPPTARDVAAAAEAGDPHARDALARAARALAVGLAAVINALDPQRVVVGGGLSRAGPWYWQPLVDAVAAGVMPTHRHAYRLVPAVLGDDAGILGAAWRAREEARG